MARDFERGNRTELEALTGALVRLADAKGVDVPADADRLRHLEAAPASRIWCAKPGGVAADRR